VTGVRFHPAAADELEAAHAFYEQRNPAAARRFAVEIGRTLDLIAEAPTRWPSGPKNTRRLVLRGFPFTLVYRIHDDTPTIVALAHQKRRPDYWYDRQS
jgi:plasmid stabilization system protein ParE